MRFAWLAAAIAISFHGLQAQRVPTSGSGNNGSPGAHMPPPMMGGLDQPSNASLNRDIYLSGIVMMDDGTPPPQPVTIERVCAGTPRAMAYTDSKGQFSFQVGHTSDVMQDASEDDRSAGNDRPTINAGSASSSHTQYNVPDSRLENCDLRAVMAGYRSDTVSLGARRLMDDPNVGTIMLHRLSGSGAGTTVSVTTLAAPKEARKAYDKGLDAVRQGRLDDAAKLFRKAVDVDPKFAAAWYELGKVQQQHQDFREARESYAKSLEADAKFMGPYEQLMDLALNSDNWQELADQSGHLLELDPAGHPVAYFYNAMANLKLERYDAAEKSARAGEKADPEHRYPKREEVLAMILAHKREYAEAAEHMRIYLQYAPDADDAARMRVQLAEYERLAGVSEQAKTAKSAN